MKVAIQGIEGSYSEGAARKICGSSVRLIECGDFAAVFEKLASGVADRAVVPLRNRIVGDIVPVDELMAKSGAAIFEMRDLSIRHVLAGIRGSKFTDISTVRSHAQALRQCSRFFEENSQIAAVEGTDTASSVKQVVQANYLSEAAICSERAAKIYGATVLRRDISDEAGNWTIFALIGARN